MQHSPAGQPPAFFGGQPAEFGAPEDDNGEEAGELVKCEDCGRSFNADRIEKHMKVCKKVFQQKRAKFNSAANRLGEFEEKDQLIHNAKKIEAEKEKKQKEEPAKQDSKPDAGKPMPKWKRQSLEFQLNVLKQKAEQGDEKAKAKVAELEEQLGVAAANAAPDPDKTVCPHCGRSFNNESAERHINICLKTFGGKAQRLMRGGGKQMGNQKPNAPAAAAAAPSERPSAVHRSGVPQNPSAARGDPTPPPRRPPPGGASRREPTPPSHHTPDRHERAPSEDARNRRSGARGGPPPRR